MPTLTEILDAMQFDLSLLSGKINATSDPAYAIEYQFAGNSQPADLWRSYTGWTALTAAERTAVRDAMDHIETFLNVSFVEITGSADPDMNIGKVTIPGSTAGYGGYNYSAWTLGPNAGQLADLDHFAVFDNTIDLSQASAFDLILHELGHAMLLKHPFEGSTALPSEVDNTKYTVMSYTANPETGVDSNAMMLYDIYALQDWWGATTSHNHGDTSYTGPRNSTIDPLWDTGGNDTIDASATPGGVKLDLRAGYFSRFGTHEDMVIPFGVTIENATGGGGNDTLNGNGVANTLSGLAGNDVLNGYGGADFLLGGSGHDTLNGNNGNDTIVGGDGRDLSNMGGGNDLFQDNNQGGTNGRDTIWGNVGNDTILGGGGADKFGGQDGKDSLTGGDGNDTLLGGKDYDTLRGGNGDDRIDGGDGRDLAWMGGGNDLFIDNGQGGVNGQDTVYGNGGNDTINGGAGNDRFEGQDGNDSLLGGGGNDKLFGGNQNDTMRGGDGADTIAGGNGRDKAYMGNGNDSWFDNAQVAFGDDSVFGGAGNDTIRAEGGNDTLSGGGGADTFIFAASINDDVVTDFTVGTDALQIDASLWNGTLDQTRLDALTNAASGDLVFTFDNGDTLTLEGVTDTTGLLGNFVLV